MYHFSIDYKLSTNLLMILKYQQLHFLVGCRLVLGSLFKIQLKQIIQFNY